MASRTTLPSDPSFLLEYMEELPNESDSGYDFEGYLEPKDGPCALLSDQDGDGTSPGEVCGSTEQPTTELESPLAGLSPSPVPMQGNHSSGPPLSASYSDSSQQPLTVEKEKQLRTQRVTHPQGLCGYSRGFPNRKRK